MPMDFSTRTNSSEPMRFHSSFDSNEKDLGKKLNRSQREPISSESKIESYFKEILESLKRIESKLGVGVSGNSQDISDTSKMPGQMSESFKSFIGEYFQPEPDPAPGLAPPVPPYKERVAEISSYEPQMMIPSSYGSPYAMNEGKNLGTLTPNSLGMNDPGLSRNSVSAPARSMQPMTMYDSEETGRVGMGGLEVRNPINVGNKLRDDEYDDTF